VGAGLPEQKARTEGGGVEISWADRGNGQSEKSKDSFGWLPLFEKKGAAAVTRACKGYRGKVPPSLPRKEEHSSL